MRIGLHTGEAIKEADDFFGKNVIPAGRIAGQALGSEILVSSPLKELTDSDGEFAFGEGREVALKRLSGTHRVFHVAWQEPPPPRGQGAGSRAGRRGLIFRGCAAKNSAVTALTLRLCDATVRFSWVMEVAVAGTISSV